MFSQISVTGEGAAIYSESPYKIESIHSIYHECAATVRAGGIRATKGSIYVNFSRCTNCISDWGASIVTWNQVTFSSHYLNSFCYNTAKTHSLYPSGNKLSIHEINASKNTCSPTTSQFGCAASFGHVSSPENIISKNKFLNCSKSSGILQFFVLNNNVKFKYDSNIHLYCVSSSYIVTSEVTFPSVTLENCVFFLEILPLYIQKEEV